MPPAVRLAFAEREDQQEQSRRDEQRARHVDALAAHAVRAACRRMKSSAPRIASGATITLMRNAQRHE